MSTPYADADASTESQQVAELVQQLAAALRMARWSGVEAVPRKAPPHAAAAPRPTAAAHPTLDAPPLASVTRPAGRPESLQRPPASGPGPAAAVATRPASLAGSAPRPSSLPSATAPNAAPHNRPSVPNTRVTGPIPVAPAAARVTAPIPPAAPSSLARDAGQSAARLDALWPKVDACARCTRCAGRQRPIHGEGSPHARLLILLDYPTLADESAGRPAQGAGGQLLERMITAMGLSRGDVWLTSLILCRDPGDLRPSAEEARTCSAWLKAQWDVIQPEILLSFGEVPAQLLAQRTAPLGELRGRWMTARQVPAIATWGLQEVLEDASKKREVWADLQLVMERMGLRR
jgi:uracil-DNA glycosylase family 4